MTTLHISHSTRYFYTGPVSFDVHRLMIRPRDAHDLRLLDSRLVTQPAASVEWEFDVFGNSVAFATFSEPSDALWIQSDLLVSRYVIDNPVSGLASRAAHYPFTYSNDEVVDLSPMLRVECSDDRASLEAWMRNCVSTRTESTAEVLNNLSVAIHDGFQYQAREEFGVQTPAETLASGSGTCRDFAFLFMESARILGFAARFVTGYLYDPAQDGASEAAVGGGATHAWADAFIPRVGWVEFDPTNRTVAGSNLVRVATTRTPGQASPVQGSFVQEGASFLRMEVDVSVSQTNAERLGPGA